jgi:hypothetical protein
MRRAFPAAALAAAALAIAGCGGGSEDDKEKIESTVHDYFTAFADGDASKACDELVPETRDELAESGKAENCETVMAQAIARPSVKQYRPGFRKAKVKSVSISGDEAEAEVSAIGVSTKVPLRKEGDRWLIIGGVGATTD